MPDVRWYYDIRSSALMRLDVENRVLAEFGPASSITPPGHVAVLIGPWPMLHHFSTKPPKHLPTDRGMHSPTIRVADQLPSLIMAHDFFTNNYTLVSLMPIDDAASLVDVIERVRERLLGMIKNSKPFERTLVFRRLRDLDRGHLPV